MTGLMGPPSPEWVDPHTGHVREHRCPGVSRGRVVPVSFLVSRLLLATFPSAPHLARRQLWPTFVPRPVTPVLRRGRLSDSGVGGVV